MAKKTYNLSVNSFGVYEKQIYQQSDSVLGTSTKIEYIYSSAKIVGTSYTSYLYKSSYSRMQQLYAYTYALHLSFNEDTVIFYPTEANSYTYRISVVLNDSWSNDIKICTLSQKLSNAAQSGYEYISSQNAIGVIPAGQKNLTLSLNQTQLNNIVSYGLALIPTIDAGISDVSKYVDITQEGTQRYNNTINITADNISVVYEIENLASPGTASAFSPSSASILVANRDNTISWKYTQEFEAPQYYVGITAKYLDTGETQEICRKQIISAVNGTVSSYTIPADTLRTGNIRLTVSAMPYDSANYYADDDAIWISGASVDYTVKDTPEAGAVSCDGKPHPTVSWTSNTQAAFQLRFGDYDSGVIAGSETSYTVPQIFTDGNYAVSIRTATSAGEWSDWTEEVYVKIENIAPSGTVTLTAAQFDLNVQLTWESTVTADNYAVFRDGMLIAVQNGNAFIDRYSSGEAEYVVYAVSDGFYAESNRITFALNLRYDIISTDGGYTYKLLKYTTAPKSQTDLYTDDVTYQYYAGREKPIAISSGHYKRLKRFAYAFKKCADALFLRSMSGKAVLIKTTRGCVIYGILGELQITEARITRASFSVREIYREGEDVEYVS